MLALALGGFQCIYGLLSAAVGAFVPVFGRSNVEEFTGPDLLCLTSLHNHERDRLEIVFVV